MIELLDEYIRMALEDTARPKNSGSAVTNCGALPPRGVGDKVKLPRTATRPVDGLSLTEYISAYEGTHGVVTFMIRAG